MLSFMRWLEASLAGHLMRETGVWTYGIVNLLHILGIALLFGAIVMLDLRLLGVWRSIPLPSLSRPAVTVAASGVLLAFATGIPMLATKATEYAGNPFLIPKFLFIALALGNVVLLHRTTAWRAHASRALQTPERRQLALMGAASLLFWLGAITCGRLLGYW